MDQDGFMRFWNGTEAIKDYVKGLPTYSAAKIIYVFAAEMKAENRVNVIKGRLHVTAPTIIIPSERLRFGNGFQDISDSLPNIPLFFRGVIPCFNLDHEVDTQSSVEYGRLSSILRGQQELIEREYPENGVLIKGIHGGLSVSLVRYTIELFNRTAPQNVLEYMQHNSSRSGIGNNEKITNEEIQRLFGH